MRIQEHITNQSNPIDAVTTSNGNLFASKVQMQNTKAMDISSIVMDDEAYKGQGMTVKDVMQEAGEMNVSTLRDYMVVMSNFMSDEDYAQLIKEGKNPGSMEATELVTSLDKIKATLVRAGVEVAGFTDTLDRSTLEEMFGDSMNAEIGGMLCKKDVPSTTANLDAVSEAFKEGTSLTEVGNETKKYIVKNEVELTIDNLYKSQFSAGVSNGKNAKGYYREDLSGYFSKKSESLNWEGLETKAKEIIQSAGFVGTQEELNDAKWIVEEGLPLKEETFSKLQEIKSVELPMDKDILLEQIITAVANGKLAKNTLLTGEKDILQEAIRIKDEVDSLPEETVNLFPVHSKITIAALVQVSNIKVSKEQNTENISAKRQMEEIRLSMSVEANYRLLKSGFSIETAALEDVIDQLKNIEYSEFQTDLNLQNEEIVWKESIFQETLVKRDAFFSFPVAMIGTITKNEQLGTFGQVYEEGLSLQKQYQEANEKYEPLLTEVRMDLGDSIRRAFANAETLVQELGFENTAENRKAIRILGYNQMELSNENMYQVKETNLNVTRCIEKMTPSKVLQLIKDGVNPLETGMEQLESTLDHMEVAENGKFEQYARFLQHMESKNQVSAEEKDAYIGIHRLLRQIEKTDGAVLGSLVNQGAEISLKNLLSAVRTKKHEPMDYEVNEEFQGVEVKRSSKNNITEQIYNYYNKLVVKMADQMETKNPTTLNISMDLTVEEFADKLEEFPSLFKGTEETVVREAREMRKIIQTTDDMIYKNLQAYEQPVTPDNMSALSTLLNERGKMYRNLSKTGEDFEEDELSTEIKGAMQSILDAFSNKEEAAQAYENLEDVMKEITVKAMNLTETGKIDQKAISLLYKQISFTTKLAKEENYEVPVMIGKELTSINLRILHQSEEKGKIFISTQTDTFGKLMAEFSVTKKEIKGFIATENVTTKEIMQKLSAHMEFSLSEDGNVKVEIEVVMSSSIQMDSMGTQGLSYKEEIDKQLAESQENIVDEETSEKSNDITIVETQKLYGVAKTFLRAIQEEW